MPATQHHAASIKGASMPAGLTQSITRLEISTKGAGFEPITQDVKSWLQEVAASDGLLTLFIRHTSASLTIQENADPDVCRDLKTALDRLAPANAGWRHTLEGPDDMPAHIKTMLTGVNLAIPVLQGELMLGTWQGIYVAEHRTHPHRREVVLHYAGTLAGI